MTIGEKYSNLNDKFIDFINGLDSEFSSIKDVASKTFSANNQDIKQSIKALQQLSEQTLTFVKKKKDENFLEKVKVTQQVMNQYSNNGMAATYDVSNNLRNLIQINISLFELSYNETASRFSKPVIGSLWAETDEWLSKFNESSLQASHRSHEIQLAVGTETIENIFANLKSSLVKFAKKDVFSLIQKVNSVQKETKEYLESYSIPGYSFSEATFNFSDKYEELIRSCLRIETPYQGTYPKKNFRSLIFEMRSFSMMFLLLLSSFGINQYIAKDPKAKTIVYIVSLVLIVIGMLVTFANAQDSREDKLEDELKKAKERISAEIKRAVNEFVSEWKAFIISNFRTIMADISAETDRLIREDTKSKTENVIADRLKLSQLSQLLDSKDRGYQELARKCETWKQQIDGLANEIEKSLQSINN